MKTIYKTTLSIFLFSVLMVFGAKTAMGVGPLCTHTVFGQHSFSTVYDGNVPQLENINCQIPFDIDTEGTGWNLQICLTPKDGFKVTNYAPRADGKTVCFSPTMQGPGENIIYWAGDGKVYPINYEYRVMGLSEAEQAIVMPHLIATVNPLNCLGGSYGNTSCSINDDYKDDYEIYSCPLESGFICPGYQAPFTYFQSYISGNPTVVINKIPKPVGVTVYGWDPKEEKEHEESMEVASAENNETNVRIYWISENAKSCTCTKSTGEGGCGIGASPGYRIAVPAIGGKDAQGNYALTETTTFKVTCNND